MKMYLCSERPKCFCTAGNLNRHQLHNIALLYKFLILFYSILKHSDVKRFCCGPCGKFFKRKENIVKHFKGCSGIVPFSDIFGDRRSNTEVSNTMNT